MSKNVWLILGVLITLAVVAVLALQGGYKTPVGRPTQAPAVVAPQTQTPTATNEGQASGAREITVSGSEFKFSPSSINLTKGETVKITFKNTGTLPHNLTIAELGISTKTVGGGQEDSVTVTADKTGSYTFYCDVGNHRQQGMEGRLEVK